MTIDCGRLADLLLEFVSGELPEEHRTMFEAHLKACPPCVVFVETYRVTIRLTRMLPSHTLPPELERRLRETLRARVPERNGRCVAGDRRSGGSYKGHVGEPARVDAAGPDGGHEAATRRWKSHQAQVECR